MQDIPTIYLDHAATTPVSEIVFKTMFPFFQKVYGNASASHEPGRKAAKSIQEARRKIANFFHCDREEIIFTSGGTESNNLAIRGTIFNQNTAKKHLITSTVEHPAIKNTVEQLCQYYGIRSTLLSVDSFGRVNPDEVRKAIRPETVLISVMTANNEIGTIQPVQEIARIAKEHEILFHTDAVQAIKSLKPDLADSSLDMLSLSGHKIYGPKGVGLLYLKKSTHILSQATGGPHERNQRAGTENVPGIVGFAAAIEENESIREKEVKRLTQLRDHLIQGILEEVPQSYLTGHPQQRLADHVSFVFQGIEADQLLMHLDRAGIFASSGSACSTGMPKPSNILLAMGIESQLAQGALRLTMGRQTIQEQIDYVLTTLPRIITKLRKFT